MRYTRFAVLALALAACGGDSTGPSGEVNSPNGHALRVGGYGVTVDDHGTTVRYLITLQSVAEQHVGGTYTSGGVTTLFRDGTWNADAYRLSFEEEAVIVRLTPTGQGQATCTGLFNPGPNAVTLGCTVTSYPA